MSSPQSVFKDLGWLGRVCLLKILNRPFHKQIVTYMLLTYKPFGHKFSIPIIYRRSIMVLFDSQSAYPFLTQFRDILRASCYLQNPFLKPVLETLQGACPHMIFVVKRMIAVVIALHGGWMRSPGFMHNGTYFEGWPQHSIRVAHNDLAGYNLLGNQNDISCCKHCFLAQADIAPEVGIAIFIAALHMDDCDIRLNGWYQQQGCAIQW